MSEKVDYTVEEWDKLKLAPLAAGSYLMAASPSGTRGQAKEVSAIGASVVQALKLVQPGTLLSALVAEMAAEVSGAQLSKIYEAKLESVAAMDKDTLLRMLRESAALISAKGTPDEISGYGSLLMAVAQGVAGAAKEDTFLGAGGKLINHAEQAALNELSSMLSLPA